VGERKPLKSVSLYIYLNLKVTLNIKVYENQFTVLNIFQDNKRFCYIFKAEFFLSNFTLECSGSRIILINNRLHALNNYFTNALMFSNGVL